MFKHFKYIIFFLLLFLTPFYTAHAFIFTRGGNYNTGARPVSAAPKWDQSQVVFYLNKDQQVFGGSLSTDVTADQFEKAVIEAIAVWQNAICESGLDIKYGGLTTSTDSMLDQKNVILWDSSEPSTNFTDRNTLAFARTPTPYTNNFISDCDIIVDGKPNIPFSVNGESNKIDLVTVLVHELGHCLGMDHAIGPGYTSTNPLVLSSVMVPAVSPGKINRYANQDNQDALWCVYPKFGFNLREPCTSYHGTNGGAAISGTTSGGPAQEYIETCNSPSELSSAQTNGTQGSGCVSKAFADSIPSPYRSSATNISDALYTVGSWFILYAVTLLFKVLVIRKTRVKS